MLTEAAIRALKPGTKTYKRTDEKGMHLLVTPSGGRLWRLKYRFDGKEKQVALGSYPELSLKQARLRRDEARAMLAEGVDPTAKRKAERDAHADTFAAIAAEYVEHRCKELSPRTLAKVEWILKDWLLHYLGSRPIEGITAADVLSVCRRLESRGKRETTRRAHALAG